MSKKVNKKKNTRNNYKIEALEPRLRRKRLLVRLGHASLQAVCRGTRLTSSDGC